ADDIAVWPLSLCACAGHAEDTGQTTCAGHAEVIGQAEDTGQAGRAGRRHVAAIG
ncbi:MAG: hypothetical protein JWR88_859, partial [Pseudonocardia sp.]|nr:hypothetical protein [Pseudonocardia sp.]